MSAKDEHVLHRLDDYLHGLLTERETGRVEGHCSACPECRAALEEARQLQAALASVPPTEASPTLIVATLRTIHQMRWRRKQRAYRAFFVLAFGSAAAILLLGLLQVHYQNLAPTPYDLVVLGQRDLLAASAASLRIRLFDRRDGRPLVGAPVRVELRRGGESVQLASFKTDPYGSGQPQCHLPDWPDGAGELHIVARTPGGEEEIRRPVQLRRSWKVMLSSDKPVYQPGQTIHVRALALRRPDLHPVAEQATVFTLSDPRGNVLFKDTRQTSRFGIAGTDCELDADIQEGAYTLGCKLGDTESKLTVEVKRYVLPKFRIRMEFDRPFYQPSEHARLTVHAGYFFGKPVAGAEVRVEVRGPNEVTVGKLNGRTDDRGEVKLTWDAPGSIPGSREEARLVFEATVSDKAGQEQIHSVERVLTKRPVHVDVMPEGGKLVRGVRNRVYVLVRSADGAPVRARLSVSDAARDLPTDEMGLASFEYTPQSASVFWTVDAWDATGKHVVEGQQVQLSCGTQALDFLLRTDRAVYDAGATMHLHVEGGGREPVFVDFLKDGQTLLTQTVDMSGGWGVLDFDLPAELSGTVKLCAYRFDSAGIPVRKTRGLYVRPSGHLRVIARANAQEYRPGGKAKVEFTLTDASGKPAPGAVSLAAVDEAVFSVLSQRPGMEQTFYLVEQELLNPVYAIYPWSPSVRNEQLEEALFATTNRSEDGSVPFNPEDGRTPATAVPPTHTLMSDSFPFKAAQVAQTQSEGMDRVQTGWVLLVLGGIVATLLTIWFYVVDPFNSMPGTTGMLLLLAGGCVGLGVLGCGQGAPENHSVVPAGANLRPRIMQPRRASPGAARTAREADTQGGTGGFEDAVEEKAVQAPADVAPEGPAPRMRERFPETLLWRPELITDDQGHASLEIDLADSITTWRLSAGAVTADGRLGSAELPLTVFQPFFADFDLPAALTRGDEIDAPLVVYNYLNKPQTVTLALVTPPQLKVLDGADRRVDLGPGEVRSVRFRLRAVEAGQQVLEVTARGSGVADALRRTLDVVPDGRPVEQASSGSLDRPAALVLDLPSGVVGGSARAALKIYPSTFSQLVEGLENIFRMPYGCFEQTSSTTYPNVLALDYLRRTGQKAPAVEATARQYIHLGYQRLVGFEVTGGGFDWFGHPPANRTLTAYGLLEFEDMARVHDVDPALIDRTRRWLLRQRGPEGAWNSQDGIFHDNLTGGQDGEERRLGTTAYIAWAVFARGQAADQANATQTFLLGHRPDEIRDPHVLALVCNALLAMDPDVTKTDPYLDRLEALKRTSADGRQAWWEQPAMAQTCFYGSGQAGQVETTALAALALLESHRYPATARGALEWLIHQKDAGGTWYSTQATVLALRALLAGAVAPPSTGEARRIEVRMDGKMVRAIRIPADHQDVLTQVDLSMLVGQGRRRVEVVQTAGPASSYQLTFRYHVPGSPRPAAGPLTVALDYDRTELSVRDTLQAHVRVANNRKQAAPMVLLDLPVPPGFVPETEDFAVLVQGGKIERFQVRPRQVLVYLRGLSADGPLEWTYRLRPALAGSVSVGGAHAYEYYAPQVEARCGGCRLNVKP